MSDSEAAEAETKDHEVHLQPGEPDEAAYGGASKRAVEAFDALPADSEHAVDYPVADDGGKVQWDQAEDADPIKTLLASGVGQVSNEYVPVPALEIELVVTTPDGRSFRIGEAQEFRDFPMVSPTDETIVDMMESLTDTARHRFAGPGAFLR